MRWRNPPDGGRASDTYCSSDKAQRRGYVRGARMQAGRQRRHARRLCRMIRCRWMYVPKPPWCWRKSFSILKDRRPAHANPTFALGRIFRWEGVCFQWAVCQGLHYILS